MFDVYAKTLYCVVPTMCKKNSDFKQNHSICLKQVLNVDIFKL